MRTTGLAPLRCTSGQQVLRPRLNSGFPSQPVWQPVRSGHRLLATVAAARGDAETADLDADDASPQRGRRWAPEDRQQRGDDGSSRVLRPRGAFRQAPQGESSPASSSRRYDDDGRPGPDRGERDNWRERRPRRDDDREDNGDRYTERDGSRNDGDGRQQRRYDGEGGRYSDRTRDADDGGRDWQPRRPRRDDDGGGRYSDQGSSDAGERQPRRDSGYSRRRYGGGEGEDDAGADGRSGRDRPRRDGPSHDSAPRQYGERRRYGADAGADRPPQEPRRERFDADRPPREPRRERFNSDAGDTAARPQRHRSDEDGGDGRWQPQPGPPREAGAVTGNKKLPYDLPLVRADMLGEDKGTFFAGSSWRQVGANAELAAALASLGVKRPSHIQAQAFEVLRPALEAAAAAAAAGADAAATAGSSIVLADQAGSGKTLAYLLPLVQVMREEEAAAGQRVTQPRCPRAVVLAPTVELVQQVARVCKALSAAGLKFRSMATTGGQGDEKARARSWRTQRSMLSEGVDLLVATPGRLSALLVSGDVDLSCCKALVMDEVDVLLGDRAAFADQVAPLRAAAPPGMAFVMVTATLPQHVFEQLRQLFPEVSTAFGPGLHRTAAGLVEELVDCSGGDEITEESGRQRKLEALDKLLARHRAARTLVFCNKIESCRDVENHLKRTDPKEQMYRVMPFHEAIRDDLRQEAMQAFMAPVGWQQRHQAAAAGAPGAAGAGAGAGAGEGTSSGGAAAEAGSPSLVLVATDRTSRGIDCAYCEHVVLFDFPRDPSEYVRRVGRTARGAGGRGTVSSLVLGRQVPLAKEIIERNQKGMPVTSLPA